MNKKGPLNTHIANTMVYIFCTVIAANGGELKEALSPLHLWNDVWIIVFGFGVVILYGLISDWLLLNGHDIAWQKMNGFGEQEILNARRKRLLFEHCETSVTKGFANGALIAMMLAVAAAFVWFTLLASRIPLPPAGAALRAFCMKKPHLRAAPYRCQTVFA